MREQKRPEQITIPKGEITSEIFFSQKYYDQEGELIDVLVFPTIQVLAKVDAPKFEMLIDEKMFTKELGFKFNNFTYSIGKLVRLAELNNDSLRKFTDDYFKINDIEDFYSRNSKCEALRFMEIENKLPSLTFGNLVNILRNIIKSDCQFHKIESLNTDIKRKKFRKIYSDYVIDRDYFTHGVLFFQYPKFNPILRIKNNKGKYEYVTYSKEIFLYNLEAFSYLTKNLFAMNNLIK